MGLRNYALKISFYAIFTPYFHIENIFWSFPSSPALRAGPCDYKILSPKMRLRYLLCDGLGGVYSFYLSRIQILCSVEWIGIIYLHFIVGD